MRRSVLHHRPTGSTGSPSSQSSPGEKNIWIGDQTDDKAAGSLSPLNTRKASRNGSNELPQTKDDLDRQQYAMNERLRKRRQSKRRRLFPQNRIRLALSSWFRSIPGTTRQKRRVLCDLLFVGIALYILARLLHAGLSYLYSDKITFDASFDKSNYEQIVYFNDKITYRHHYPTLFLSKPPKLSEDAKERQMSPNYGDLYIDIMEEDGVKRAIYHDYKMDLAKYDDTGKQIKQLNKDGEEVNDDVDFYYAFDDDEERNPYSIVHDEELEKKHCRRTNWHRNLPINCNTMHEFDPRSIAIEGRMKFVGSGSYRNVFLMDLTEDPRVVFKTSDVEDYGFDYSDYEFIRMDGLVSERLTAYDNIVDMYAFCGIAFVSEAMMDGELETTAVPLGGRKKVELNDKDGLDPRNNFTAEQKLQYGLEMAEAIAVLHSFPDGMIIHDDIQMTQFLFTPDGHLKLNDFNRAEVVLWNEEDQEYCKYRNYKGQGDWRSPEEYFDYPLTEKIDVFSFGNNLYSVLTGLYPFYDLLTKKVVQAAVKEGKKPFIDPRWRTRSFAEGKIVELIEKCFEYKPEDRIDIFGAVKFLREVVEQNKKIKNQDT